MEFESCDFDLSLLFKHLRSKPCDRLNVFTLAGVFVQLLEKSGDWKFCGFWILQGNLSEVVDHPSGVDVDEDHDDGGDDGEYVDQVPVDDQTVKRPAFFRVGIGGVQNGLQEKRGGVIDY